MKNVSEKLGIDPEKYEATQQFMNEKGMDIEQELSDMAEKFYKKYVPADVRKYIERSVLMKATTSRSRCENSNLESDTSTESRDSGA
jgi:phosphatidate phosphatase PAH1